MTEIEQCIMWARRAQDVTKQPQVVRFYKLCETALRALQEQPDVVHGRWIEHIDSYENYCECSVCHYIPDAPLDETNSCPNCGAKMDEVQ